MTNKQYLKNILKQEVKRQNKEINLIASENWVSNDVLKACGSVIQNKYAEGYSGKRYYKGCENVDKIEDKCNDLLCELFHARFSNCQPHSGASANLAAYSAACKYWKCKPKDIVGIGLELSCGGHLTHFNKMTISGDLYKSFTYKLDQDGRIDYDEIEKLLLKYKKKHIILSLGYSAYSEYIDYKRVAAFITKKKISCIIICDISHIAGIIAAEKTPNPLDYYWGKGICVITSTTHKTLKCARHAFIATDNEDLSKCINKAVFPYLQGGPLTNMIAGVAMGLAEIVDNKAKYNKYIQAVLDNVQALMKGIQKTNSKIKFTLGGSVNHLCLVDLNDTDFTGKEAEDLLEKHGIVCNRNTLPGDSVATPMGLRLGTAYMTAKGWNARKFYNLGKKIGKLLLKNK